LADDGAHGLSVYCVEQAPSRDSRCRFRATSS
jgi:hypothetical protein